MPCSIKEENHLNISCLAKNLVAYALEIELSQKFARNLKWTAKGLEKAHEDTDLGCDIC